MAFAIKVNGNTHNVDVDGDTPLLWVLRNVIPKPRGSNPFLYPTATPACGSLLVAKARSGGPNPPPTSSS